GSSDWLSRRAVLAASAFLGACRPALAQLAGRNYRLGFVAQPVRSQFAVLLDELQRRGFIEGSNLSVDPRGFGLAVDELEAAALVDPNTNGPDQIQELIEQARSGGINLSIHYAAAVQQIVPAIEAARAADTQALDVLASAFFNANRNLIIEQTARARLPAIYQ